MQKSTGSSLFLPGIISILVLSVVVFVVYLFLKGVDKSVKNDTADQYIKMVEEGGIKHETSDDKCGIIGVRPIEEVARNKELVLSLQSKLPLDHEFYGRSFLDVKGDGGCAYYALFANLFPYLKNRLSSSGNEAELPMITRMVDSFLKRDREVRELETSETRADRIGYFFTEAEYNRNLDVLVDRVKNTPNLAKVDIILQGALIRHFKYLALSFWDTVGGRDLGFIRNLVSDGSYDFKLEHLYPAKINVIIKSVILANSGYWASILWLECIAKELNANLLLVVDLAIRELGDRKLVGERFYTQFFGDEQEIDSKPVIGLLNVESSHFLAIIHL